MQTDTSDLQVTFGTNFHKKIHASDGCVGLSCFCAAIARAFSCFYRIIAVKVIQWNRRDVHGPATDTAFYSTCCEGGGTFYVLLKKIAVHNSI